MRTLYEMNHKTLAADKNLGVLLTADAEDYPHITIMTSLSQLDEKTVLWAQFCRGESKYNVKARPKTGFYMLTEDAQILRGKAIWRECRNSGAEYEVYSNLPRYRYNVFYGYSNVHYMDISASLPSLGMDYAGLAQTGAQYAAHGLVRPCPGGVVSLAGLELLNAPDALQFAAYIGEDGFPVAIPCAKFAALPDNTLLFALEPYPREYENIPDGARFAAMSFVGKLGVSLLLKGIFARTSRDGKTMGSLRIERIYSPNLPVTGYIYPMPPLVPVREFDGAPPVL